MHACVRVQVHGRMSQGVGRESTMAKGGCVVVVGMGKVRHVDGGGGGRADEGDRDGGEA